jgi:SnoaL-like domain
MMTGVERLLALEEIKLLRTRWSRLVDELRWSELDQVLTEDAVLDLSGTSQLPHKQGLPKPQPVHGARRICQYLEQRNGHIPEQLHIVSLPEIEFQSDTEATGVWRQESFVKQAVGVDGKCGIAYGTIHDTYRKVDGHWLMHTMQVSVDLII